MTKRIEKIAGAVLFALILIVGINLGGDALDHALTPPAPEQPAQIAQAPAPDQPAQVAEAPPAPAGEAAASTAGAIPDLSPEPIAPLVAAADVGTGEAAAKKCVACHTFTEGGPNRVGPNLHGVVGREIAAVDGFAYSGAMKALPGTWTTEALDSYLLNPRQAVPGTKMAFAGVKDNAERAALIAYLRSVSPGAPPLEE